MLLVASPVVGEILLILLIIAAIGFLIYKIKATSGPDIIEEPNPEYLEQLSNARTAFVNELLEHLRLNFALPQEIHDNISITVVGEQMHRINVAYEDQVYNIVVRWDRDVTLYCFRNQDIACEVMVHTKKTFRMRYNIINWKAFAKFCKKTADRFFPTKDEIKIEPLIVAAKTVSEQVDDQQLLKMFFYAIKDYPWDGSKRTKRMAASNFVALMSYALKYHREELLEFLKQDATDKTNQTEDSL